MNAEPPSPSLTLLLSLGFQDLEYPLGFLPWLCILCPHHSLLLDHQDLSAIVRSCKATTFTNPTTVFETPTPNTSTNNTRSPLKPTDFIELEKLTTIINPNTTISTPTPTSTSTSASAANILKPTFTIGTPAFTYTSVHNTNQNSTFYDVSTLGIQQEMQLNPQTDLFTRKNQQMNLVCHVNTEKLLEDPWAWRKYGQKPIKGSPYPRNYYKCSSAIDCAARKLVDKSTSKEDIFVVTYVGQHNHEKPVNRTSRNRNQWLLMTHFVGCKPCGKFGDYPVEGCLKQMDRAYNFWDNKIFQMYDFTHKSLASRRDWIFGGGNSPAFVVAAAAVLMSRLLADRNFVLTLQHIICMTKKHLASDMREHHQVFDSLSCYNTFMEVARHQLSPPFVLALQIRQLESFLLTAKDYFKQCRSRT
uniref:Uncharacterized protein LOC113787197 n=1 Tax=Cicer arietinum TaxID=3827 RepID=A0A3Q7Y297_CICAR|nr:uncharacterized protein LOC113787197 [Cicer arietinum]